MVSASALAALALAGWAAFSAPSLSGRAAEAPAAGPGGGQSGRPAPDAAVRVVKAPAAAVPQASRAGCTDESGDWL